VRLAALVAASSLFALASLELCARFLDGYPLFTLRLPPGFPPAMLRAVPPPRGPLAPEAAKLLFDSEVDAGWIDVPPPALANRGPVAPDLLERRSRMTGGGFDEFDLYNVWNRRMIEERACSDMPQLLRLPMPVDVFEPVEPSASPPYRYYPARTTPLGLTTNAFGFRGPDVPLDKPAGTVRVAFLGASTTVGSYSSPFSYPEYVVHWLNLWAAKTGTSVRFDLLNSGRTGMTSKDIAAIARQEVLPLEPDLLVYYEGANQFVFADRMAGDEYAVLGKPESRWESVVRRARPYSALVGRVSRAIQLFEDPAPEPAKPRYTLRWPEGLDRQAPDIDRKDLPLDLTTIVSDLHAIREASVAQGADLAVASFVLFARDGLEIPARRRFIYDWLNQRCWPYTYADLRMLADFQNTVLERFAKRENLLFVDLARRYPMNDEWFLDAVHFDDYGIRLQAWIVFQSILPRVRERMAARAWPRPDKTPLRAHPNLRGYAPMSVDCAK
jgi:hypothetical protein